MIFKKIFLLSVFTISPVLCMGQNWQLSSTMKAALVKGVLTISTTQTEEPMPSLGQNFPWKNDKPKITTVIIEEGVTSIPNFTFYMCVKLTSIKIPKSVQSIDEIAFAGCITLKKITVDWENPITISVIALVNTDINESKNMGRITLSVPKGTEDVYKNDPTWKILKIIERE